MKKCFNKFVVYLFLSLVCLPCCAMTLEGNAEFNVESARQETFNNIKYSINGHEVGNYLNDPHYVENYKAVMNGDTKVADRYVALFSDGTYGVRYEKDPYHNYYYESNGSLFKLDVLDRPFNEYPHKSVAYDKSGAFMNATLVVSKREQYLYDMNKRLLGHWLGDTCYDEKGRVLMFRKTAQ